MNIINKQAEGTARKDSYKVGDTTYIIESNRIAREVTIIKLDRDFCTVRFADTSGAIKIRRGRLFSTRDTAEDTLYKEPKKPKREGLVLHIKYGSGGDVSDEFQYGFRRNG